MRAAPKATGDAPRLVPGAFALTDSGNAKRFVTLWRDRARYSPERRSWLIWDGTRWAWDWSGEAQRLVEQTLQAMRAEARACDSIDMRKALQEWATKSESLGKRTACETLARSEAGVAVKVDSLDADPWLLNCANGTLDLRLGTLLPHAQSDLITKTTGIEYREGATSHTWESVLAKMTGGDTELATYLQRVAGYALTGVATEKKFFFLHGPRDSGKSSYIQALLACLGDYAKVLPFETWLDRPNVSSNRDDLVSLQGVRLAASSEVSASAKWNTALVKQITGGDRISASAKYESMVEFQPACTIILAANDAPRARDDDEGFWGRMQRVPITRVIPKSEQLKNFLQALRAPECAQAILSWAVRGCLDWQEHGIGTARVVEESSARYQEDQDWLAGFLAGYVEDEGATIAATVFRDQYERYCKQEGQHPEATKTLAQRISKRMPGVRYKMLHGARLWSGLRLAEGAYAREEAQRQEQDAALPRKVFREPEQGSLDLTMPPEERWE